MFHVFGLHLTPTDFVLEVSNIYSAHFPNCKLPPFPVPMHLGVPMCSLYSTVYTLNAITTVRPTSAACYSLGLSVSCSLLPQYTNWHCTSRLLWPQCWLFTRVILCWLCFAYGLLSAPTKHNRRWRRNTWMRECLLTKTTNAYISG